jgi:uncharacterized protein (UPF0218 family)
MSDQLVVEISTLQHNTHNRQKSMSPVEFEPAFSAGERPQTYALDRATTRSAYQHSAKPVLQSVILVTNEAGLIVNEGIMNVNIHHSWANVSTHGMILSLLKNLH